MSFSRTFLGLFSALLITGCASVNVQHYGQIDQSEKTITVPAGGKGLLGDIKQILKEKEWAMAIYAGPKMTEKANSTLTKEYNTFNTRYTLFIDTVQYDVCIGAKMFEPAERFDISIVDNKSGTEVVTMSGSGCNSSTIKKLEGVFSNLNT